MFQVIASGFGFAVLKVGSTLLATLIATQGVRIPSNCPTPRAMNPGLHRPAFSCLEPEFLPAANVPENSCKTPRTHHQEDVPYGRFGPELPCYPPLPHGSSRFEARGAELRRGGIASSSWSPTFVLLHSHLLRHTSRLHPRPDLFPTVRLAHFATRQTVTTSVTQRFASSCCHARPSCIHGCFSDAQPHFRGVSAISLCHAAPSSPSLTVLSSSHAASLFVTTVSNYPQPLLILQSFSTPALLFSSRCRSRSRTLGT